VLALCLNAGYAATLYLTDGAAAIQAEELKAAAADADMAIECHDESREAKQRVIAALDSAPALYVSALSCSVTEAASWSARPAQVVGWGALPPLVRGGTVELAAGLLTNTLAEAETFWSGLDLKSVHVADSAGLVRARIICALVNEAATALAEGVASAADIDTAMRLGTNYPYGPLAWGDRIGLDVVLGVMRGLQAEFGEDRYRPCPLLAHYVQANRLGHKTSRGFFEYEADA
jgi:3-hydroxybutyryl-CoA dehydrogenase